MQSEMIGNRNRDITDDVHSIRINYKGVFLGRGVVDDLDLSADDFVEIVKDRHGFVWIRKSNANYGYKLNSRNRQLYTNNVYLAREMAQIAYGKQQGTFEPFVMLTGEKTTNPDGVVAVELFTKRIFRTRKYYEKQVGADMKTNYIDLGLPSGNLWATENEPGYFTYNEALKNFGNLLPSKEDWEELFAHCEHEWDDEKKGLRVYNNFGEIFLPAAGYRIDATVNFAGSIGHYWSSTAGSETSAYGLYFNSIGHWNIAYSYGLNIYFSVQLVEKNKLIR